MELLQVKIQNSQNKCARFLKTNLDNLWKTVRNINQNNQASVISQNCEIRAKI